MDTNKDGIYCQVCLVGCVEKHQHRRNLENISENVNFKAYAEK